MAGVQREKKVITGYTRCEVDRTTIVGRFRQKRKQVLERKTKEELTVITMDASGTLIRDTRTAGGSLSPSVSGMTDQERPPAFLPVSLVSGSLSNRSFQVELV